MIEPGDVVDHKYRVERVLGRGGMGIVVSAIHVQLEQRVALKVLRREAASDHELVQRFMREARSAVRLRGEHIGRVFDVGTLADGVPYIVLEYLQGHDLASELARGGRLPVTTAVDHLLQACLGLAEAHGAGLVHRDLKPANLFLTRRPDGTPLVKVMDFGIAKAADKLEAVLTESGAVMGSPGYMSPEQLRSARDVDARADIWSLGVCLYELTTGRRPYAATTITELAMLVATEPVPPLPGPIPRGFSAVVMRCLEKDPARRYPDVASVAAALAPFGSVSAPSIADAVARIQAGSPPMAPGPAYVDDGSVTTLSRANSTRLFRPSDRRRLWPALVAALAVAAIVPLAILLTSSSSSPGAVAPAAVPDAATPGTVTAITADAGVPLPDAADPTAGRGGSLSGTVTTGADRPPDRTPRTGTRTGSASGSSTRVTTPRPGTTPVAPGSAATVGTEPVPATPPPTAPGPGPSKPSIPGDSDGDGIPDIR